MKEIILEKRYPHSREEDITDAFMRGYEIGKEQEHRWWSAFCANCKTESNSEIPNNSTISKMEQVDEPRKEQNFCGKCRYLYRDFKYGLSCYRLMDNEPCKYEERKDEPQTERKCIDCRFLTYKFGKTWCDIKCDNPHDKVCDRWTERSK